MVDGYKVIIALLGVLSVARGGDNDNIQGITLTNLTHTGFNQTIWSSSVKLAWSVHTPLLTRFAYYQVKCLNTLKSQRNYHIKRIYDSAQQEAFIYRLLQNTEYTCCVELQLNHDVSTASCSTIEITSPSDTTAMTANAMPTVSTEHAQIGSTGYTEEQVAGLYVVIGLLCVLLTVSVLGWLTTGLVAYWKKGIHRSRKVEPGCETNPRNHIHNPLYTSDYVPSGILISASNNIQHTTPHEYDYVRVREPEARSSEATNNRHSIGQPSTNNYLSQGQTRTSIQNESALPLHYETMATYGNRIANRVDTTSPH